MSGYFAAIGLVGGLLAIASVLAIRYREPLARVLARFWRDLGTAYSLEHGAVTLDELRRLGIVVNGDDVVRRVGDECICHEHKPICDCVVWQDGMREGRRNLDDVRREGLKTAEAMARTATLTEKLIRHQADPERRLSYLIRDVCVAAARVSDGRLLLTNLAALDVAVNRLRERAPYMVLPCKHNTCMHPSTCTKAGKCSTESPNV
jgi:hypothetical protein